MADLRARLGVPDGDPDPTPIDLLAVHMAEAIVERAWVWYTHHIPPADEGA